MVRSTGKGHGEQHCVKSGKPLPVHAGKQVRKPLGHQSVRVIKKLITGDQSHTGIDEGGHISQAENLCPFDIKIFGEEDDGDTDNIDGNNQAYGQTNGIPEEERHIAGKEETDYRKRIRIAGRIGFPEYRSQRIETGNNHKAKEKVDKENASKDCPEFSKTIFLSGAIYSLHETHLLQ